MYNTTRKKIDKLGIGHRVQKEGKVQKQSGSIHYFLWDICDTLNGYEIGLMRSFRRVESSMYASNEILILFY